ncbi:MAG: Crp/Fnr family transcriptional regulator [Subtercola sp.]|nr:Crp/Fnr family transcriptional regulator [Subtercola sp.]
MFYPDTTRFSDGFLNHLKQIAHLEHYPKGKNILTPGEPNNKSWYIKKGIAKIYHYIYEHDKKNKDIIIEREIITCFLQEQDTLNIVDSFFGREMGKYYIEPIEDCTVYAITKDQFEECYRLFPEVQEVAREIILGYKQKSDLRANLLSLKAEERFVAFSKTFNTSRLSIADLVAYLHVSRTHLGRIRKDNLRIL